MERAAVPVVRKCFLPCKKNTAWISSCFYTFTSPCKAHCHQRVWCHPTAAVRPTLCAAEIPRAQHSAAAKAFCWRLLKAREREKYHFVCLLSLLPTRSQQGQHFAPLLERHTGEMSEADTLSFCGLFNSPRPLFPIPPFSSQIVAAPYHCSLEGWHRMAFCCAFLLLFLTCQSPSLKCHKSNYFGRESWR